MTFNSEKTLANELDEQDPISQFRSRFYVPKQATGEEVIYLTGNSLGLQPRSTKSYIEQELEDWKNLGVEGHFHAKNPWMPYHEIFDRTDGECCRRQTVETVVMNSLTVNLHLLMVSFYRPTQRDTRSLSKTTRFLRINTRLNRRFGFTLTR